MSLQTSWVHFKNGDKSFKIYTSRLKNAKTPLPAVLVIQEIWGTDTHILDLTDRFAKAGYLAVAPDLYAENGERPEEFKEERIEQVKAFLNSVPPSVWHDPIARETELNKLQEGKREEIKSTIEKLFGWSSHLPVFLDTLKATVQFLDDYEYSQGQKIASTGYCMGGALSGLLASVEPRLAGAVIYYGNLPSSEQIQGIQCPISGFFGSLDERITSQVAGFAKAMQEAEKSFTYEIYQSAHHAFFNDTRVSYDVNASRDAWIKTLNFFKQVLA